MMPRAEHTHKHGVRVAEGTVREPSACVLLEPLNLWGDSRLDPPPFLGAELEG
jgi:hypothetical protein